MMSMDLSILKDLRDVLFAHGPITSLPDSVVKRMAALNTWGSNSIEGNTLGLDEVLKILERGTSVGDHPMWELLETVQHESAFLGLPARAREPIGLHTALELHREVFINIMQDAGLWRDVEVIVVGAPFRPVAWQEVPSAMASWEAEYKERAVAREDALALAAWMHHRFESIHPFSDGNGRTGRLLLNLHLIRHGWPPVSVLPPDQQAYYDALNAGHGGDLSRLEDLLRLLMARSLLELLGSVGTGEDELLPLSELAGRDPSRGRALAREAARGGFPALKDGGTWKTSKRVVALYKASGSKV
jgi:Fic family protein